MEKCTNYGLLDTTCYFQPNWVMDQTTTTTDPFESALSSMVSSPTATPAPSSNGCGGGSMVIRELIGRLGSIRDNTEFDSSTNTSCYTTPLNSPPSKFNLSSLIRMANDNINPHDYHHHGGPTSFNADPGFVERAAKFSSFVNDNNSNNDNISDFNVSGGEGRLSRENSEKKMVVKSRGSSPENDNVNDDNQGDSREGSSVSDHLVKHHYQQNSKGQVDGNSKKRKATSKSKVKGTLNSSPHSNDKVETENEETDAKRSKVDSEENNINNKDKKQKSNSNNNNNSKEEQQKAAAEPPKDYIHVRARRGQATDSHSLAERVRREKISERMKFLQDLVPGCNKVTGKATVLDEIINYVQSLQHQVEFLSMKLATVNPRMEFNMEALLSKDMFQSRGSSLPQSTYPLDQNSAQAFPFGYQSNQQIPLPLPNGLPNGIENSFSVNQNNAARIRRNPGVPFPSIDGFTDSMAQLPSFWEDDLRSIVQMGLAQDQPQNGPGTLPNSQMKLEL